MGSSCQCVGVSKGWSVRVDTDDDILFNMRALEEQLLLLLLKQNKYELKHRELVGIDISKNLYIAIAKATGL